MPVRNESIQIISAVRSNLESCIMGKSFEIQLLLTALLAGGHVVQHRIRLILKEHIRCLKRSLTVSC